MLIIEIKKMKSNWRPFIKISMINNNEEIISGDTRLSKCVVWTGIPMLSWICPALGHVGICDSHGVVHDFEGSGYIGTGHLLFGDPRQRCPLDIDDKILDDAIEEVSNEFSHVPFNILCSNCHFYVCSVLKRANYPLPCCCGKDWTFGATIKLVWLLIFKSRSLSFKDFIIIWLPFLILWAIIIVIILLTRHII